MSIISKGMFRRSRAPLLGHRARATRCPNLPETPGASPEILVSQESPQSWADWAVGLLSVRLET